MPELDKFEKTIRAPWWSPYRLALRKEVTSEQLADKVQSALAKRLREIGGVPGFGEILKSSEDLVRDPEDQLSLDGNALPELAEFFEELDLIEQREGYAPATRVAVRVAKSVVVRHRPSPLSQMDDSLKSELSEAVCGQLIKYELLDRGLLERLVEKRMFTDIDEAKRWWTDVESHLNKPIARIASQLVRDPTAKRLRASARSARRESTADLLSEPISAPFPPPRSNRE